MMMEILVTMMKIVLHKPVFPGQNSNCDFFHFFTKLSAFSFCGRITLDWTGESPDNSRFSFLNMMMIIIIVIMMIMMVILMVIMVIMMAMVMIKMIMDRVITELLHIFNKL